MREDRCGHTLSDEIAPIAHRPRRRGALPPAEARRSFCQTFAQSARGERAAAVRIGVGVVAQAHSNGPLIFWMYPVFGIRGASWFLGVFAAYPRADVRDGGPPKRSSAGRRQNSFSNVIGRSRMRLPVA